MFSRNTLSLLRPSTSFRTTQSLKSLPCDCQMRSRHLYVNYNGCLVKKSESDLGESDLFKIADLATAENSYHMSKQQRTPASKHSRAPVQAAGRPQKQPLVPIHVRPVRSLHEEHQQSKVKFEGLFDTNSVAVLEKELRMGAQVATSIQGSSKRTTRSEAKTEEMFVSGAGVAAI